MQVSYYPKSINQYLGSKVTKRSDQRVDFIAEQRHRSLNEVPQKMRQYRVQDSETWVSGSTDAKINGTYKSTTLKGTVVATSRSI